MSIPDKPVMLRGLSSNGLWRLAAMVLLLYAAADILLLDTGLWDPDHGVASCDESPGGQHSFCSCSHFVVARPVRFTPVQVLAAFVEQTASKPVSAPAAVLEPPPRA